MSSIGQLQWTEFLPFIVFFGALVGLLKKSPSKPWIIAISVLGIFYGLITSHLIPSIKPKLLRDFYPEMINAQIVDFSYLKSDKITAVAVAAGALEVGFVAVLETLISAKIADGLTSKYPLH